MVRFLDFRRAASSRRSCWFLSKAHIFATDMFFPSDFRYNYAPLQGENELASSEPSSSAWGKMLHTYTLFCGHAGPVHSATFRLRGGFILSSSSDCTIRLWSTKLNANLVCYKGHNYPVWDVQFSPMGHYFTSASHDLTARIWSMDRIQPLRIMADHLSDVDFKRHASIRRQLHSPLTVNFLPSSCEGSLLASGSADCTVKIWDVATSSKVPKADENSKSGSTSRLRSLTTLPTKSSPVYALQFSRRNLLFAAGALSKQS